MITKRVEKPSLTRGMECSDAHDAHEMLGWRTFERGGWNARAQGMARALLHKRCMIQCIVMYHQPGIGGPDNLSRLHLRAQCTQSQIDHTRTVRLVRLRIVRITAQGRDWCLVLGLLVFIWWSDRDFPNPQFAESFSNNKIANWGWVLGPFCLYMVVWQRFSQPPICGKFF